MARNKCCPVALAFCFVAFLHAEAGWKPTREVQPSAEQAAALQRAEAALAEGASRAAADQTRPVYHFRPPAYWMNDPCGGIFYRSYYHLFYQLNPYADHWATIHWGHARSKDLVHWEHLPIALAPQQEEVRCNSGCVAVNKLGVPMIFYTRVPRSGPRDHRAAIGDSEMTRWRRHPANPLLTLETHGGPRFGGGWSDPFVFEEAGRTFMVIGVDKYEHGVAVPIYEAQDDAFRRWKYCGLLYSASKKKHGNMEVPMVFKLGGKWVLLFHAGGPTKYLVGSIDFGTLKFESEKEGSLALDRVFTSPHVFFDDRGRCILYAWISGFQGGRGWNGCLALPQVLSLDEDGTLVQKPVPELGKLRGKHYEASSVNLEDSSFELSSVQGEDLEIIAEIELGGAESVGVSIASPGFKIAYDGEHLGVGKAKRRLTLLEGRKTLRLHAFLDRSVLEVFADGGRVYLARIHQAKGRPQEIKVFATGGGATLKRLDVWQLDPIWKE